MIFTGSCTQPAVDFMAVSSGIPPHWGALNTMSEECHCVGKSQRVNMKSQTIPTKKKPLRTFICPSVYGVCSQSSLPEWKHCFPAQQQREHEKPRTEQDLCFLFLSNLVFSNCSLCVHRCRTSRASTQTPLRVNIMKAVRIAALCLSCKMSSLRATATPTDSWHTPRGVDLCVFVWTCC